MLRFKMGKKCLNLGHIYLCSNIKAENQCVFNFKKEKCTLVNLSKRRYTSVAFLFLFFLFLLLLLFFLQDSLTMHSWMTWSFLYIPS